MDSKTLQYYDQKAREISTRYESRSILFLHNLMERVFPKSGRILELGSGTGRDSAFLEGSGRSIVCSDGTHSMLSELEKYHPELGSKAIQLRLPGPFPFPNHSFDGCLAVAVLMHLEREKILESLSEIARILVPGGVLFFSIPTRSRFLNEEHRDEDGRLYSPLLPREWEELSSRAGFKSLESFQNDDALQREGISWTSFHCILSS